MGTLREETYRQNVQETSITVAQSEVESIRTKNITRTTARVFDGAHLGVAGALGDADAGELVARAREGLDRKIPYPFEPMAGTRRSEQVLANFSDERAFVSEMRDLVAEVRSRQPGFVFAGKLNLATHTREMRNDTGLDYSYRGTVADTGFWIKEKGSPNIVDLGFGYEGIAYDRQAFVRSVDMLCDAFSRRVELDDGVYPVVFFSTAQLYRILLYRSLHGLAFGSGTSLFSGRIGEQILSEQMSVVQSRSPEHDVFIPFFDFEGAVNPDDRFTLIDRGKLVAPFTSRAYAAKFGLPHTGASAGEYDSVPNIGMPALVLEKGRRTAAELIDGRRAILVVISSGGDFTPDGAFASPVQLGYLYDGKELVGRIPEVNISSHLYRMFGEDFAGVSTDSVLPVGGDSAVVMNMKVEKGG